MVSGYVLVSTLPGMQDRVFRSISTIPEVRAEQWLFGTEIAVRLDASEERFPLATARLASLDGVAETRVYKGQANGAVWGRN